MVFLTHISTLLVDISMFLLRLLHTKLAYNYFQYIVSIFCINSRDSVSIAMTPEMSVINCEIICLSMGMITVFIVSGTKGIPLQGFKY